MSYIFTYPFKEAVLLDNKLNICWADEEKVEKGNEISAPNRIEIDTRFQKKKLNEVNNIRENSNNYILYRGTLKLTFTWTDEDNIDSNDLDVYESYLESEVESWNYTRDLVNKTFTAELTYLGENDTWGEFPLKYFLDTSGIKFEAGDNNMGMLCVLRKNIEDNYKIRQLDIAVNGTTKIDKPICSTCYVLFSQSVEINGTTLPKHSQKRLENNELNVKNLGDIPCKVIQYYI
tara:strand:- start:1381 stop:2079 length:699 start_codon:yes stop_codon:yes gene_type:complete